MNYLMQIGAIASNTVRESLRNRIVYALMGSTALVMFASLILGWISDDPSHRLKVIVDFSLSAILLFGTLTSIFLGTNLIYQEIERRTVYTLLARPISRAQFVLGKFAGLVAVNAICLAAMSAVFLLFFMVNGGALHPSLFAALYMTFLELVVVTGIALVFSVTAHPIEGAVFAFVVCLAGHATGNLLALAKELTERTDTADFADLVVPALTFIYRILPNLESFDLRGAAANSLPIGDASLLPLATGYALIWSVILLCLSVWSFGRRKL